MFGRPSADGVLPPPGALGERRWTIRNSVRCRGNRHACSFAGVGTTLGVARCAVCTHRQGGDRGRAEVKTFALLSPSLEDRSRLSTVLPVGMPCGGLLLPPAWFPGFGLLRSKRLHAAARPGQTSPGRAAARD